MKTVVKEKEVKKERKDLEECLVLWRNKSKAGEYYLSGNTSEKLGKGKVVGFFNTYKKNPKEPDIRIYDVDSEGKQGNEIADLWEDISKNEKRYLTGTTNENERLIAFYGDEHKEMRPYIRVYFKQD